MPAGPTRRNSKPHDDAAPFLLRPSTPRGAGVLLVHGFSATPQEMRLFGQALCDQGYTVLAILLPGHGTSPQDLATKRYEDWLEAVEEGYRELKQEETTIFGMGLSTGALLVLALAARVEIAGMVLLSPYLRLRHRLARSAWWLRHIKPYHHRPLPPEAALRYYESRPLNGVHQIHRLIRHLRPRLGKISTPALAINGSGDQTIRVESGQALFTFLGSRHKEYHLYGPEVPHVLCTEENPRWRSVLALSLQFLAGRQEDSAPVSADGHRVP